MNDSSTGGTSRQPSEEQMDDLLREFFVLETPSGLRNPLHRSKSADTVLSAAKLISVPVAETAAPPRSRRVAVASAISALAMALMVAVSVQEGGSNHHASPALSETAVQPAVLPAEERMNVSGDGDSVGTGIPVREDGTTQEELDSIQLAPRN